MRNSTLHVLYQSKRNVSLESTQACRSNLHIKGNTRKQAKLQQIRQTEKVEHE